MSMKDKSIRIDCWSGKLLFIGEYDSPEVDKILDANRCLCEKNLNRCPECDDTGYIGDFTVSWIDEQNDIDGMNVYEYINY